MTSSSNKLARRQSLRRERSQSQQQQSQQQQRNNTNLVQNVKTYANAGRHEINVHLNRVPKMEAPTNRHERAERKSRRQLEKEQQQTSRKERLTSIQQEWSSHRTQFMDMDEYVHGSGKKDGYFDRVWNTCCGCCCGY